MNAKISEKKNTPRTIAPNNRPFNVHYALEWGYSLHGSSVSAMTRFMVWKPFCGSKKGKNYILHECKNVGGKKALTNLPAPNNGPFNVHYALEWGYSLHESIVSAMTRFVVWKPFCGSNYSL